MLEAYMSQQCTVVNMRVLAVVCVFIG